MKPDEFYSYMFLHLGEYLAIFAILAGIYVLLLKKRVYSIFDPLFVNFFASQIGATTVLFLYYLKLISDYYFISYLLTQAAFITGFMIFKPINIKRTRELTQAKPAELDNGRFLKLLFVLSSIIYVFTQSYAYYKLGIPVFMDSRQQMFVDAGALTSLKRFISVCSTITIFLGIHYAFFYNNRRFKAYSLLMFAIVVVFGILSGAKSTFFGIIVTIFIYVLYSYKVGMISGAVIKKVKMYQYVLLVCAIAGALVVINIQKKESAASSPNNLIYLVLSWAQRGDSYWYSYPNGMIENIEKRNPFPVLFSGVLGNLKLISKEDLPDPWGVMIYRLYYKTNLILGPNPRHNVYGLTYFGYWISPIYSFILGWILGFTRFRLYRMLPGTVFGALLYCLVSGSMSGIETDVHLCISSFTNVVLIVPGLLLFTYAITMPRKRAKLDDLEASTATFAAT